MQNMGSPSENINALNGCLSGLQEDILSARHKHDQLFRDRKKKVSIMNPPIHSFMYRGHPSPMRLPKFSLYRAQE